MVVSIAVKIGLRTTAKAPVVTTAVSAAALLCLLVAVELQVRLVEEPYLLRTHRQVYASYAAATGRFVPGLGRLRRATPGKPRS